MAIKKRDAAVESAGGPAKIKENLWTRSYPTLWEFLSTDTFEDGSARRLPTVTIFLGSDGLQACLNDREQGLAAFVTSNSMDGLWQALEKGLKDDSLDWRRSSSPPQKKSRK